MTSTGKGELSSRATLVIVPPNICDQWEREVLKFFRPGTIYALTARDVDDLKRWSVADVESADLVIVSYRIFASKSYPKRRQQLEQGFGLDSFAKFPVLELFYFHRVVFDEFHELVDAHAGKYVAGRKSCKHPFHEAAQAVRRIRSSHRWGITSTPPLDSLQSVVAMASLFQVELSDRDTSKVIRFVMQFVRRNSVEPAKVSLVQRKVLIAQTVHERALYSLRRKEGVSRSDLLAFASVQWSWSAVDVHGRMDQRASQSAYDICQSKLKELYKPVEITIAKLREAVVKLKTENFTSPMSAQWSLRDIISPQREAELGMYVGSRKALQVLAHFLEDDRLDRELAHSRRKRKAKDLGAVGTCGAILCLLEQLADDYTPVLFFETSIDESEAGIECPICFTHVDRHQCSISDCGHTACADCWSHMLSVNPRCHVCREKLDEGSLTSLAPGDRGPSLRGEAGGSRSSEATHFGSKMGCVIDLIAEIHGQDPAAKVLIFCQFEEMKVRVMTAFKEFAVQYLHLDGSTESRGKIVQAFLAPEGPRILLSSMAVSPSGVDLSVANHVLIVQPTCHHDGDSDKSVDYEAQSIGRCWRMGQEKPVFVHRLCMAKTVEEAMVEDHMALWRAKFGALQ